MNFPFDVVLALAVFAFALGAFMGACLCGTVRVKKHSHNPNLRAGYDRSRKIS